MSYRVAVTSAAPRLSFFAKWTLVVVPSGLAIMGALVSGMRPLIAASGLLISAGGLVIARDWRGASVSLSRAYARSGLVVPARMLRLAGRFFIAIGCAWTVLPLISYLQ
jgi:hypothetical protein